MTLRIRDQYLPLRYFLLFAVFIQATALLFFAVAPQSFPYSASRYVDNGVKTCASFLFLLPWGHALVYYIFDFSWPKKIFLTLLTLVFVAPSSSTPRRPQQIMPRAARFLTEADWAEVAAIDWPSADPLFGANVEKRFATLRKQIDSEANASMH